MNECVLELTTIAGPVDSKLIYYVSFGGISTLRHTYQKVFNVIQSKVQHLKTFGPEAAP